MQNIQVYELYDVWYHPWWQKTPVIIAAITLLAIITLCGLWWCYSRFIRRKTPQPFWHQALEQCHLVRQHIDTYDNPEVYKRLTAILKQYLSFLYKQSLQSVTDKELVEVVNKLFMSDEQKVLIVPFLQSAEGVKFAHEPIDIQSVNRHINDLVSFITKTRPGKNANTTA